MAPGKKTPGDRRRTKKARGRKAPKPEFTRPREWAEQELIGVKAWLVRLQVPTSAAFPESWREGQIRHYKKRARDLRAEIRAHKARAKGE